MPELATGENGLITKLIELEKMLLVVDPELALHLKKENVESMHYADRWLLLLLSREFEFTFIKDL